MHKHFALLAIIAMVGVVSCNKNPKPEPTPTPEPDPDPVTATITAADVTVDEGATVSINASTNSTAAITYASKDAAIATVNDKGEVTGVKAGNTQITLKVAAVDKKFTAAEKTINVTVNAVEVPPTPVAGITIDGEFEDWPTLEEGTYTKFINDPDSPWEAVDEVRCYATPEYVYYYIKYSADWIEDLFANENEILPMRLNINTDGEFTSGYTSYFLEGYDFMVEGHLLSNGEWGSFDGGFYQRIGSWVELLGENSGMCSGAGKGCEYEIQLNRAMFNEAANKSDVPMPMGDDFQTSLRFYFINEAGKWDELSNMPNSSVEEELGNGYGYLMRIHTNK